MKTLERTLLQLLLVLVVLGAGAFLALKLISMKTKPERKQPDIRPTLVEVINARRGNREVVLTAMGTVLPARRVVLKPEVAGRIISHSANLLPGGRLRQGEMAVQIDPRDYELSVEGEKAKVEKAEYELRVEQGRQVVAQEEWRLLEQDVTNTKAGKDLALRVPHLRNAQAAVAGAKSALEAANLQLARTRIEAPFNAIVQEEAVEVGEVATPQTSLATLIGADQFWVRASVPVDDLRVIEIPAAGDGQGSRCTVITGNTQGISRPGRVIQLLGDVDPVGRMARILVAVDDPLGLKGDSSAPLLVGAYVRVEIQGKSMEDVCPVPRKALREGNSIWVMNEQDELEVRSVEIVWREQDVVLVRSGIEAGERIVTSQLATPVPGMKLRLPGTLPEASSAPDESAKRDEE